MKATAVLSHIFLSLVLFNAMVKALGVELKAFLADNPTFRKY